METTSFIPVFHAYIPFGQEGSFEERYLFEYLAGSLYPLLRVFEGLENEGIEYGFTLCFSPVLAGMLDNPAMMMRYEDYLKWRIAVVQRLIEEKPDKSEILNYYLNKFKDLLYWHVTRYRYQPLKAVFNLAALGKLEVIFSNAGNGILPQLEGVQQAAVAEIRAAVSEFGHYSEGGKLRGLWLTELAYSRGMSALMASEGIEYFFVDESAFRAGGSPVVNGNARPVVTDEGINVFAVNSRLSRKIDLSDMAYCYDPIYSCSDTGSLDSVAGELLPDKLLAPGVSGNYSGVELYCGSGIDYSPQLARDRADVHAAHYLSELSLEVERHNVSNGVIVVALDHESVGRNWAELPVFIDMLLRKMRFDQDDLRASTPGKYLERTDKYQVVELADSSLSANEIFAEYYRDEREKFLTELHLAAKYLAEEAVSDERIGDQMARELMLAQGYEWKFYAAKGVDEQYPNERKKKRLARFAACKQMLMDEVDYDLLAAIESRCAAFSTVGNNSYC